MKKLNEEERGFIKKRTFLDSKKGIVILKNIFPAINSSFMFKFLEKYGKIEKIFFFKFKGSRDLDRKLEIPKIFALVEFKKKLNALRFSILTKISKQRVSIKMPFEEALYIKGANWKELTSKFG